MWYISGGSDEQLAIGKCQSLLENAVAVDKIVAANSCALSAPYDRGVNRLTFKTKN
jgi:hypothetical protein